MRFNTPKFGKYHQQHPKANYADYHSPYRKYPLSRFFAKIPWEVPILTLCRFPETKKKERRTQQDGDKDRIEYQTACNPVEQGQQYHGHIEIPAPHNQCGTVARRLFTPVKELSHKPYIVNPFQNSHDIQA